ncbi:glycoside hydrolase family 31 protein [Bacillus sp. JJ1609]|uniref:glycoside hydrolase family 31 protein n=1 Tax=Bacillus sp. JJ1609 TaxID=3122977 RepID=UPI002FFF12F5
MLEDTSFAIRPDQGMNEEKNPFQDIGNAKNIRKTGNGIKISADNGELAVVFYRDDIIRFVFQPLKEVMLDSSPALVLAPENSEVKLNDEKNAFILEAPKLTVLITKTPIRITVMDSQRRILFQQKEKGIGFKPTGEVICHSTRNHEDHFYGLGEKTGYLDKRGEKLTMWNTDVYAPHNPETDALYQSHPYFMVLRNGAAQGIHFDNTFKSTFDFRSEADVYSFGAEGGKVDFYVMAGPGPKDVLEQYTALTGRAPIPPKWAIGYHQSRYSYESEQEVRELAAIFKEKKIPLDAVYLDIHYMNEYRVFTFDRERFPEPENLVSDLKEQGIRIIPIVDPGVKEDPEYPIYQEGIYGDHFCKYIEGSLYFGDVWPGNSAFPDFTSSKAREWWGEKHKYYTDLGIEGIWNDMNEPSVFNESKTMDLKVMHKNDGNPKTHRELHNVYGLLMGEATYDGMKKQLGGKRPFLLTRAGFSGVQRYAAVWTGDNRSFWEHLQLSIPMVMNLGLSGIPFAGPDVGGFAHDSNGELLARWSQVGAFTPYFRNHSAIGTLRQEPWSFGEKYEQIIKKYIELRYQWLPQLYTLFAEAWQKGVPVMRPLMLEYPEDQNTFNLSDQFMLGNNIIVAPIMQPSAEHRAVYLPEGEWVDYWTDEVYVGGSHHLVHAPLEVLPIFIKKGTVIALGEVRHSTAAADSKRILHYYYQPDSTSTFKMYDDDGTTFAYESGEYCLKTFEIKAMNSEISLKILTEGRYEPEWQEVDIILHDAPELTTVDVNGEMKNVEKNTEKTCTIHL